MKVTEALSLEGLLVFVAILIISAISNWIKRRQGSPQDTWPEEPATPAPPPLAPSAPRPAPPPLRPAETRPPPPAVDWEEQLRRLLEGEAAPPAPKAPRPTPAEIPAPSLPAPPVVIVSRPRPSPPPPPPSPSPSGLPLPKRGRVRFPEGQEDLDTAKAPDFVLAGMEQSARAYQRGSSVDALAQGKLDQASAQTAAHVPAPPKVHVRALSPEAARMVAQVRDPRAARQAVLASVVLGPPKCFEV